jgi:LemA protein
MAKRNVIGIVAIAAFVVILLVIIGGWYVGIRNRLVTLEEGINAAWSEIDNQLQRRSDLIPNLVATVKGFAKQELQVFTEIAEARAKLAGARTVGEKAQGYNQLESALGRLLVVVERYPELKSSENFIRLQDELAGTENRIAVERRKYNEAVQRYNTDIELFPNNIAASLFGFARNDAYFRTEGAAREAPAVKF